MTNDPLLTVDHVGVAYRGVDALIDVSFSARTGELVGVVGPNGAGKSTLLKAILGLLPFTGSVALDGRAMAEARDLTAYVPQRASVDWDFPATALDVVLQGMVRETG
ncbi:MAG: ATP-binding cassette domain-containing protein, partial [Alphaproteobacteria bacterium]